MVVENVTSDGSHKRHPPPLFVLIDVQVSHIKRVETGTSQNVACERDEELVSIDKGKKE